MRLRSFIILCLLALCINANSQTDAGINRTDEQGRKQGRWIKKYPDGKILYDGFFKDDHPVGEMKRFFEDQSVMSDLTYSDDGRKADAIIYHPNGYISSKGTYYDQMKEGTWKFYSEFTNGYLVSEEVYTKNHRNGLSFKLYPDSTKAEKLTYVNDVKQGEWLQYYPSGTIRLRTNYRDGKLNGKFEVWYDNGAIEFSGRYNDDTREGEWLVFNKDGSIRYKITYVDGVTKDRQMDIDESDFLDSLEKNKGKISDPEKNGIVR